MYIITWDHKHYCTLEDCGFSKPSDVAFWWLNENMCELEFVADPESMGYVHSPELF